VTLVTEITNSAKEFGTQDFRNSSGSLAIFTPILRASSVVSNCPSTGTTLAYAARASHAYHQQHASRSAEPLTADAIEQAQFTKGRKNNTALIVKRRLLPVWACGLRRTRFAEEQSACLRG
jgi:hypothetical protein